MIVVVVTYTVVFVQSNKRHRDVNITNEQNKDSEHMKYDDFELHREAKDAYRI